MSSEMQLPSLAVDTVDDATDHWAQSHDDCPALLAHSVGLSHDRQGQEQHEERRSALSRPAVAEELDNWQAHLRRSLLRHPAPWLSPTRPIASAIKPTSPLMPASSRLTPRETTIIRLICRGLSNKAMARALGIAPETVKSHMKHILLKLNAQTRAEAVATAAQLQLI